MVSMGFGTTDRHPFDRIFQKMHVSTSFDNYIIGKLQLLISRIFIYHFLSSSTGLKPNGIIVVKENITSSGEVEMDDIDSSVTRPDGRFHYIFDASNLEVIRELQQKKFPQELYNVKMYAMRPKDTV